MCGLDDVVTVAGEVLSMVARVCNFVTKFVTL